MHVLGLLALLAGSGRCVDAIALIAPAPAAPMIHGREVKTAFSTCGYLNGDPALSWVAGQGFNCRVDIAQGVWGFCPTSVVAASDCGLGGFCFDAGPCSKGCGRASLKDNPKVTTWTWYVCIKPWLTWPSNTDFHSAPRQTTRPTPSSARQPHS